MAKTKAIRDTLRSAALELRGRELDRNRAIGDILGLLAGHEPSPQMDRLFAVLNDRWEAHDRAMWRMWEAVYNSFAEVETVPPRRGRKRSRC